MNGGVYKYFGLYKMLLKTYVKRIITHWDKPVRGLMVFRINWVLIRHFPYWNILYKYGINQEIIILSCEILDEKFPNHLDKISEKNAK
jgi:hypothetical protein